MNSESKKPSKVTPVISGTRAWSSGNIKFTVLTVEGHPKKKLHNFAKALSWKERQHRFATVPHESARLDEPQTVGRS